MNMSELVEKVAKKNSMKKADAKVFVDNTFDIIADTLIGGDEVTVYQFGTFKPVVKAARVCNNPLTGGKIDVPEKQSIRFKLSSSMKRALN